MSQPIREPAKFREVDYASRPGDALAAGAKSKTGCRAQVGACAYPSCRCHLPLTRTAAVTGPKSAT